jgi:hypothetical protein
MRSIRSHLPSQISRATHSAFIRINSLTLTALQNHLNHLRACHFPSLPLLLACPNPHSFVAAPLSRGTAFPLPPDAISCLDAFQPPVSGAWGEISAAGG